MEDGYWLGRKRMKIAAVKSLVGLLLCLSATACSTRVPHPKSLQGQGMKVSRVNVELPPDALEGRRKEVFGNVKGLEQLQDRVTTNLAESSLLDPNSGVDVNIKITSFRIRNGATRAFFGMFSGSDHLHGELDVSKGGTLLLQMPIEVSGGNGNPFNISSAARSAGLINSFSSQVVNVMRTEALVPQPLPMPETTNATRRPAVAAGVGKATSMPIADPATSGSCSVDQILSMKTSGLKDSQIRAACK